jgi:hypothetical protein
MLFSSGIYVLLQFRANKVPANFFLFFDAKNAMMFAQVGAASLSQMQISPF